MAPPRRTPRDSSGRFAASEDVFSYHTGNVKVKTGQSGRNAIGATENALLLAEIFKKLIDADISQSCVRRPAPSLHPWEKAPEPVSDQFGSAVRAIHDSGGSGSARGTSELFNNSPTPIDLTNFPSARKRRATETTEPDSEEDLLAQFDESADQAQDVLPVIPRRYERPVTPAEGFVPIQIVADKLTHLGQPWKPLTVSNRHKWPPVISAEDARKLRWESYDQIGQPSQDN
ncbi:hypothetical protein FOC1_g10013341 [Fusarium oxysporum f. sp. cubense race 1]|uniref:Uncharacterized protein n=1 Tax=Fusarium oxysporum f. sp. cubense (strain race 1) TaxID=1229664 RepID=N4UA25_FUSC1|nr:hypothetical protein FOC1_g10013341 [Fusarium oxysporum f. sp. cubense race 1]